MNLFAPRLAFVDLETSGMGAATDGITEVGIVRVDCDGANGEPCVTEWSSLVNPGHPIPPAIQALTGITDSMVRAAPRFADVAAQVLAMLSDAVLVAHNARFDYGFLKHAFARLGHRFRAPVLCTVKVSRRIFPDADRHHLDAIIERHRIPVTVRHRALADARVLWAFVQDLYRCVPAAAIEECTRRILRTPSLPAHLAPDVLDDIPETPGVYLFHGLNAWPLYIGKSRNLRDRVAAHFCSDYRSPTDSRLSSEIRRITFEETAGELGALLREAALVKSLLPAHNHALRRKREAGVLEIGEAPDAAPRFVPAAALEASAAQGRYGPFSSRRQARAALHELAREHRLCWTALGLERRVGPCFARQVSRCEGVCVGAESAAAHHARLLDALEGHRIPAWPYDGAALIRERAELGERVDVHVVRDWCWLGTARDEGELGALLEAPPRPSFDADIVRLLVRTFARRRHEIVPVAARCA